MDSDDEETIEYEIEIVRSPSPVLPSSAPPLTYRPQSVTQIVRENSTQSSTNDNNKPQQQQQQQDTEIHHDAILDLNFTPQTQTYLPPIDRANLEVVSEIGADNLTGAQCAIETIFSAQKQTIQIEQQQEQENKSVELHQSSTTNPLPIGGSTETTCLAQPLDRIVVVDQTQQVQLAHNDNQTVSVGESLSPPEESLRREQPPGDNLEFCEPSKLELEAAEEEKQQSATETSGEQQSSIDILSLNEDKQSQIPLDKDFNLDQKVVECQFEHNKLDYDDLTQTEQTKLPDNLSINNNDTDDDNAKEQQGLVVVEAASSGCEPTTEDQPPQLPGEPATSCPMSTTEQDRPPNLEQAELESCPSGDEPTSVCCLSQLGELALAVDEDEASLAVATKITESALDLEQQHLAKVDVLNKLPPSETNEAKRIEKVEIGQEVNLEPTLAEIVLEVELEEEKVEEEKAPLVVVDQEDEYQHHQQQQAITEQPPTMKQVDISIAEHEFSDHSSRGLETPTIYTPVASEDATSEDLEWEFDNEPQFEVRQVEVKRNSDPRSEFELGDELGRGRFGTVYKCVELSTGRKLAAKFVHMRRREDRDDVEREVAIMSVLQHKRLLQLYDAYDDGNTEMCLITELVEGGELFERIIDDDFELTEKKAAIFMRQICEGVEYMHSRQIVHLDMKPENILCLSKSGNRIKLIDFGLARQLCPNQQLRVMFGTPDFAAPEVLAYDTVSLATDMWSVGVICYVLLSGLSPFMGDNDMETMANVTRATYDFESSAFEPITDLAKDFISKLLVREQSKRLKPSECLKHAWLQRGGAQLEAEVRSRRQSMATTCLLTGGPLIDQTELAALMSAMSGAPGASPPPQSPLSLDKRNLKKYVVRRKWHKTVHAIMALGRMGANLKHLRPRLSIVDIP